MLKIHRYLIILASLVLLATFIGCAPTRERESTGQYIDSTVITSKVKAAIFKEPTLKTLQIKVESFKGNVQLSGFVDTEQSATRAEEVALSVKGVVSVKNDLVVK
jgi:osmotically-inducible protein OsmY